MLYFPCNSFSLFRAISGLCHCALMSSSGVFGSFATCFLILACASVISNSTSSVSSALRVQSFLNSPVATRSFEMVGIVKVLNKANSVPSRLRTIETLCR